MKKKTIFFSLGACLAVGMFLNFSSTQSSENSNDELVISSVEVYASGEGTSNTGPRNEVECVYGGHKMVCGCTLTTPCTDSECY